MMTNCSGWLLAKVASIKEMLTDMMSAVTANSTLPMAGLEASIL